MSVANGHYVAHARKNPARLTTLIQKYAFYMRPYDRNAIG